MSAQDSIVGKVIDSYRITDILGKGGMGVVYKAKDMTLDRDVALKMMNATLARDAEFLKRFKSEAKALAKLQNPNIVTVFAMRETELGFFLVMEYVEGGTLSDRIRSGGAMQVSKAIPIFRQITTALDHAHRVGVIHRDIKPSNIMLTDSDIVKVTDFGLAKIQQVSNVTVTQGTGGTLYYMSPEQVKGLANVDARGDIYSIGMTLYETLIGRTPFANNAIDYDIRQMIVEGKIPAVEQFNSSVPKELSEIIRRSIHKDPAKRYQTCAEMCDALSAVSVPRDEAHAQPVRSKAHYVSSSRRPLYATLLTGALALVVFFLYRWFFVSSQSFLSINSNPEGAAVIVNGRGVGSTPIRSLAIEAGNTTVRLESEGYRSKDTTLSLKAGTMLGLSVPLSKVLTAESSNRTGVVSVADGGADAKPNKSKNDLPADASSSVLLLRAVPDAAIVIDGKKVSERSDEAVSLDVSPGTKKVLFQHPNLGSKQFTVTLRPRETKRMTCYFEAKANVTVSGGALWAFIVRNGVTTEETTPKALILPPGRHRIGVSKVGYEVVEGEKIVLVEPSLQPKEFQLAFTLKKQ